MNIFFLGKLCRNIRNLSDIVVQNDFETHFAVRTIRLNRITGPVTDCCQRVAIDNCDRVHAVCRERTQSLEDDLVQARNPDEGVVHPFIKQHTIPAELPLVRTNKRIIDSRTGVVQLNDQPCQEVFFDLDHIMIKCVEVVRTVVQRYQDCAERADEVRSFNCPDIVEHFAADTRRRLIRIVNASLVEDVCSG